MSLYDEIRPVRRQDPRDGLSRWDRRLLEALSLDHWRQLGHIHAGLRRDDDGGAQISFRAQSEPEWTEAFAAGMAQVMLALPS